MNNKKSFLIMLVAFVLLIVGAYVLYNNYAGEMQPSLSAPSGQGPEEPAPSEEEQLPPAQGSDDAAEVTEDTSTDDTAEEASRAMAPDFTVTDLEGNAVRLSDFVGKPVVLNFWASWCGPCKSEMPGFDAVYAEQGDEVHFLMVNLTDGSRETVETASAYVAENGYSFPVYYDTSYAASIAYGVYSVPQTYFIDAEGCAVAYAAGAISADTLRQGIEMAKTAAS